MILAWGAKVSPEFCTKVLQLCKESFPYEEAPNDLMTCMAFESAGTFSASIKNAAGSGAVGLIQFMPATADDLGTSSYLLSLMTPEDQLGYVQKYFRPYTSRNHPRIHSLSDMYMAILMPKYVSASDDAIVFTDDTRAYQQNRGLDTDKNGQVTKGEICARLYKMRQEGLLPNNSREINT
jgi:hypothetical protein